MYDDGLEYPNNNCSFILFACRNFLIFSKNGQDFPTGLIDSARIENVFFLLKVTPKFKREVCVGDFRQDILVA